MLYFARSVPEGSTKVVGKGSFTVLLVNNGEIAYIPKGITIAAITILIMINIFLFIIVMRP